MEKIKVKIALAIDANGAWNASGWGKNGTHNEDDAMDIAVDGVNDGEARYWIEAEVAIPKVKTISGKVINNG